MDKWTRNREYAGCYKKDSQSGWTYVGQWYIPLYLKTNYKNYLSVYLCEIAGNFMLLVIMGFIPAGPMLRNRIPGVNYFMVAYGLMWLFYLFVMYFGIKIMRSKMILKEHEYVWVSRMQGVTFFCAAAAFAMTAAILVYLVFGGPSEELAADIILLALSCICLGINIVFCRSFRKTRWEIKSNSTGLSELLQLKKL